MKEKGEIFFGYEWKERGREESIANKVRIICLGGKKIPTCGSNVAEKKQEKAEEVAQHM